MLKKIVLVGFSAFLSLACNTVPVIDGTGGGQASEGAQGGQAFCLYDKGVGGGVFL